MKSIATKDMGIINASNFESIFSSLSSSYYALIGKSTPWANNSTGALDDSGIEEPYDTTAYKFDVLKNGIFLKRITTNDLNPVIPRVDWTFGDVYFPYDQTANLFVKILSTQIQSGNVNVSLSLANTVNAVGINFNLATPAVTVGSIIKVGNEIKEVIKVNTSGDYLQVNTNFTSAYTKANVFKITTSTVEYANKFYVRNSKDQVFKCLFNNNNATVDTEPQTSIGGQSPGNPYITTADGYKWKYMYTIPSGLKRKFFTSDYMPVHTETITTTNAVDGRIDIVKIVNGGNGYYNGLSTTNYSPSSNVVTVTGDGSGAQLTVDITDGVITGVNILNGGTGYTTANIAISDPLQTFTGTAATLQAIISPKGGHGSDPSSELGASYRMLSVDFDGGISGKLPVDSSGNDNFRQFAIVKNPRLKSNATIAFNTTGYSMCDQIRVTGGSFNPNTTVYVGTSYSAATFTAKVVHYDSVTKILFVNSITGESSQSALANKTIYEKDNVGVNGTVIQVTPSDINILSGQVLYIENRAKVIRNPDQIESTRIVFAF